MIILEPESCYATRQRMPKPLPPTPAATTAKQPIKSPPPNFGPKPPGDFWTTLVFEHLQSDEPVRIVNLVNMVARHGNFSCRSDRETGKIVLLKLVGKLIRTGRLDRVRRRFVTIPASDERRRAYLEKFSGPLNFPAPQV